jgi:hypothetical protein
MAALVVDASIALAWGLPDETSAYADAFTCENGITPTGEQKFLAELSRLTIHIAQADALTVIRDGTAAAVRFGLTAYDAAYLDLALREGLPLASLDSALCKAAGIAGVALFQP